MVEARQRSDWWHTAVLLAAVRNLFATKGHSVTPAECHPMEHRRPKLMLKGSQLSILRDVFCAKNPDPEIKPPRERDKN